MRRIAVVGTRGVPAKYGGYETFADEFARFNEGKCKLTIYGEGKEESPNYFHGASLEYLPFLKSKNQIRYYWISILKATKSHDTILITGPGGGFCLPIVKLLYSKKKFVVNPDGLEFIRSKWSPAVRFMLWCMSWFSVLFADSIIADSVGIANYYTNRLPYLKKKFKVIEYGSNLFELVDSFDSDYYLLVARMVPENNLTMIVNGFIRSNSSRKLIVVSDLPKTDYLAELEIMAKGQEAIQLIGPIYEKKKLELLRCNAFAHFHGHSVGGTNPSLLEAMSSGAPIIAHNNVFNREVLIREGLYFANEDDVVKQISFVESRDINWYEKTSNNNRMRIAQYYNWDRIFTEYLSVL